jgi:hypothetical protein
MESDNESIVLMYQWFAHYTSSADRPSWQKSARHLRRDPWRAVRGTRKFALWLCGVSILQTASPLQTLDHFPAGMHLKGTLVLFLHLDQGRLVPAWRTHLVSSSSGVSPLDMICA